MARTFVRIIGATAQEVEKRRLRLVRVGVIGFHLVLYAVFTLNSARLLAESQRCAPPNKGFRGEKAQRITSTFVRTRH